MRKLIIIAASIAALARPHRHRGHRRHRPNQQRRHAGSGDDGVVDLPALNSQFTKMTITVNDGTANWGPTDLGDWTTYQNGDLQRRARP